MTPEQLLGLLPNTVLSALVFVFLKRELKNFEVFAETVKELSKTVTELKNAISHYATKEALADLRERVVKLEGRIDHLERDK